MGEVGDLRSVGQTSTFSEHGHVAYQIKENHAYSNMIANILPADHPSLSPTLGVGSIGQNSLFQTMVMLQIQ